MTTNAHGTDACSKNIDDLRDILERSRERVGIDAEELQQVVATALARAGTSLESAAAEPVGRVETFRFDPAIRPSRRIRHGQTLSTICANGGENAVSGQASGGTRRRSAG